MLVDLELRVGTLIVLLVVVPADRTAAVQLGCLHTLVSGSTVSDRFLVVPVDWECG